MSLSGPARPVGLVVAVQEEAQAVLSSLLPRTRGKLGRFPFWRGPLGRREVAMIQSGPGLAAAEEATRLLVERQGPNLLMAVGLCGGLAADQQVGDVLVASRLLTPSGPIEVDPRVLEVARRAGTAFREAGRAVEGGGTARQEYRWAEAVVVSRDRVLVTAAEKRREAESGAQAVDMESSAVAGVALEKELPWISVRVVSDTVLEDLPLDFNQFTDPLGQPQRLRILLEGLKSPRILGQLLTLERTTRRIGQVLVKYLEILLPEMVGG